MTTPVTHSHELAAAREKLPPAADVLVDQPSVAEQAEIARSITHQKNPTYETPGNPNDPPGPIAKSIAHWVHKHPEAHKHGVGLFVYQYLRSLAASVPYGIQMALTLAGLTKLERVGQGIAEKATNGPAMQRFGRGLNAFAKFPAVRASALVGTAFTLYRGTSKLMKWMTEYVFNPKDTEQRTAEKIDDLPQEAIRKIKEIAPAEYASTPISAIVLGFVTSAFTFIQPKPHEMKTMIGGVERSLEWTAANFNSVSGWKNKLQLMWKTLADSKTKFIPQAAIFSIGYALFFELGDRLFKDVQIRRGVWPGEHNSIKALKAPPEEYERGIKASHEAANQPKFEDGALQAAPDKHHYTFFNSEPNLGRFIFRRLLPTTVGITAYTAAKFRWASMLGNDFSYKAGESIIRKIPKLARTEGLATSLFFLIPIVAEPWERAYDNFWDKKEKIARLKDDMKAHPEKYQVAATPHQQQKYEELRAQLNAKEKAANDAKFAIRA